MIVRSFFRGVVGNNVANAGIRSNATNALTTDLTTKLTIIINGTTIFDALYNTLTAPVNTTVGSITTTLTALTGSQGSGYKLVVNGLEVWQQATMRVIISQASYYTYDNSFYLFGYDLGNNPNESITDNVLFDVVMLKNWSSQPTQVGNAYSKITCYRKPYSDRIYCYDMTSQPANYYNYSNTNDNRVADTRNWILCDPYDVEVDISTILGRWIGGQFIQDDIAYADQDILAFNGVFIPKYNITPLSPLCNDQNCTFIDADTGQEVIFNSNLASLNVDDSITFPYVNIPIVINFKAYDVQGNLLDEQSISITTSGNNFAFDPSYIYSYDPGTYTGDLFIVTTIGVDGVYTCTNQYITKGCGYLCITKIGCNKYTLKNISGTGSITYNIGTVDDNTFSNFTTKSSGSLNRLEQVDIDLGDDNLYVIQVTDGTTPTIQFLPAFCKLDACLAHFVKKIICSERPKCNCGGNCGNNCNKVSSTTYEFNSVMSLAYMYFSIMNTNQFFDNVFLSNQFDSAKLNYPNDLKELYTIKDIFNQAKAYCVDCGCHHTGSYQASQNIPIRNDGCSSC